MSNIERIVSLKQKGFSETSIAQKLDITQQAVSKQLLKAKKEGLWNGNSGQNITEQGLTLNGEKPKVKGAFRCSKCHRPLIPIDEVTFKPSNLRETLKQHGFTHLCVDCKMGFARETKPRSEESENCPYCGEQLVFLRHRGMLTNALYCEDCKKAFLVDENGVKKIEKYDEKTRKNEKVSSKQIKEAMQNIETRE